MAKLKVICCCGAGMGTCMLVRSKVDKVLSKLGVEAKVDIESVNNAVLIAKNYDAVVCNHNLASKFAKAEAAGLKVLGLVNVTNLKEIEEKFLESGLITKAD